MTVHHGVIVVGGGAPGEHCAAALADGGPRVAVIERELVGGECSYWACTPSKTLLRPGKAVHAASDAAATAQVDAQPRSPGATSWCRTTRTPVSGAGWSSTASTCCAAPVGSPDPSVASKAAAADGASSSAACCSRSGSRPVRTTPGPGRAGEAGGREPDAGTAHTATVRPRSSGSRLLRELV